MMRENKKATVFRRNGALLVESMVYPWYSNFSKLYKM